MYRRILVPIDGSPTSQQALKTAIGLAQAFKARLRIVHVADEWAYISANDTPAGYTSELLAAMTAFANGLLRDATAQAQAAGVEADNMVFDHFGERLGEAVSRAAKLWEADLIVVGTHGRRGVSRLVMGSGAEQVIRMAPVPVLVIRSQEP